MKKLFRIALGALALAAALALPAQVRAQSANAANLNCRLLSSTARTTTSVVVTPDQDNAQWSGVVVMLNISTYTSGTFTPTIQGKDPVSGNYYTILTGTGQVTSVGSPFVLRVYPGASPTTAFVNDILPRTWRVSVLGTATPSAVYSVGCSLIK